MVFKQFAATYYMADRFKNTFLFLFIICISCGSHTNSSSADFQALPINKNALEDVSETGNIEVVADTFLPIITGANQTSLYLPLLQNKSIAIVGNQTSVIFKETIPKISSIDFPAVTPVKIPYIHIVDSLQSLGVTIKKVFAPEHGFRGKKDAAELILDGKDIKTGIPIVSLYGNNKKPSPEALRGIDMVVFDIQDVGVRFYTYISTLHYVMQACAEQKIPVIILDRPNPNGHYIGGPTLQQEFSSFLGMHPIPLVHGMTIGEYAQMINGEKWLGDDLFCDLSVISLKNYDHQRLYSLPIRPSPNLPNDIAVNLYPSLGFFEGTSINAGRGTEMQFQVFGSPDLALENYDFAYTPKPNFGAKNPKHKEAVCYGRNLIKTGRLNRVNPEWLIEAYRNSKTPKTFFKTASFTAHAGSKILRSQIESGKTVEEIEASWQEGIENFKKVRAKYLLYP